MERVRQLLTGPTDEGGAALRKLGGLLLAVGVFVLLFRRQNFEDPWGDFPVFLLLAVPAVFFYGAGFIAARSTMASTPWASVYVVLGLIFIPFALAQFVDLVGGTPDANLNVAWIFLTTAAAGVAAGILGDVRFGFFAASVALIIAWLALWNEIISDGITDDFGTFRGLCMAIAAVLVAVAFWLRSQDPVRGLRWGAEAITGAGLAFLLGAGLVSAFGGFAAAIVDAIPFAVVGGDNLPGPSAFWDTVLLVGSLLLVAFGSRFGTRGPVYVGAIGLVIFAVIVGLDLDDDSPAGKAVGWPLILLLAGAAAFLASLRPGARYGSLGIDRLEAGAGEPPPPPPPPPAPPPPRPPAGTPPD